MCFSHADVTPDLQLEVVHRDVAAPSGQFSVAISDRWQFDIKIVFLNPELTCLSTACPRLIPRDINLIFKSTSSTVYLPENAMSPSNRVIISASVGTTDAGAARCSLTIISYMWQSGA